MSFTLFAGVENDEDHASQGAPIIPQPPGLGTYVSRSTA